MHFKARLALGLLGLGAVGLLAWHSGPLAADTPLPIVMGDRSYSGPDMIVDGHLWAPVLQLGQFLNLPVAWDGSRGVVTLGAPSVQKGGDSALMPVETDSNGANVAVQIWSQYSNGVYTAPGTPGDQWADLTVNCQIQNNGPKDILLNFSRSFQAEANGELFGVDYAAEVNEGSTLTGWQTLEPNQTVRGNLTFLVPKADLGSLKLALVGTGGQPVAEWAMNPSN